MKLSGQKKNVYIEKKKLERRRGISNYVCCIVARTHDISLSDYNPKEKRIKEKKRKNKKTERHILFTVVFIPIWLYRKAWQYQRSAE